MALKGLKTWIDSYQPGIEEHYDKMKQGIPDKIEDFWAKWVDENSKGLSVAPPYATTATSMKDSFSLSLPQNGMAPIIAKKMADAWKGWISSITYAPPAPVPPFSSIISVTPSQLGIVAAYASLLAGLTAEMLVIPPDPNSAFKLKAVAMGTLFYTATMSAGVQIDGLSLSVPPAPLSIPLFPTL